MDNIVRAHSYSVHSIACFKTRDRVIDSLATLMASLVSGGRATKVQGVFAIFSLL